MKRAVIYARYSSELQDERSIEDQVRVCRQYADNAGWTVVDCYSDAGISGASMITRKGIQKLLADARDGQFDIVVSEALDRLSRDTEDTAHIYKQLSFCDVRLVTRSEGEVDDMMVGFKGTMNSMFLKELRRKTHRGLEGRVLAGKSAGGKSYGYDTVKSLDERGERITGERTINEYEASIVRRIFEEYVKGKSPRKIAFDLNKDGVPGPSGKGWGASTIYGNRQRGTGIINNELYIGRQVWNRLRYMKDPSTGKKVARLNPESDWITVEMPELRIIEQGLWDKVKEYQGVLNKRQGYGNQRRPANLLSFLLKCGECGGGMSMISRSHYGCSTSRNKGTCANRTTIAKDHIEYLVLDALRSRLMNPALVDVFCKEYTEHVNRSRMEQNAEIERNRREIAKIERDMKKYMQAILDGMDVKFLKDEVSALQQRKEALEATLDAKEEVPVFIHPNMAHRYADAIRSLMESLNDDEHRAESAKIIRTLVDEIILTPNADRSALVADMKGDLAAILSMAGPSAPHAKPRRLDQMTNQQRKEIERAESVIATSEMRLNSASQGRQVSMVAGVGFEPTTFRL
ncbi:recombinase family protein [Tropicimonas aquimaris]|uniref:Recombinase family protein n=1 Tax=Tropicimonas aquimaris TaxID=914152 RepID=A0ABW3IR77_9RHOB